jgi:hypothetical protein
VPIFSLRSQITQAGNSFVEVYEPGAALAAFQHYQGEYER